MLHFGFRIDRREPVSTFLSGIAAVFLGTVALARDPAIPADVVEISKTIITRDALEAPIRFLASDALEGRGPATRADTLTRLYLSTELEQLGFDPGGPNGQWEQPFDVVTISSVVSKTWSFQGKRGSAELKWHDDFVGFSSVPQESASIDDAEVVFVGYGIQAPEYEWDDFKGANLEGKVLLMVANDPDWDPNLFAGKTRLYYGMLGYKSEIAARHKAAGVILIHTPSDFFGLPWQTVQSSTDGRSFHLADEREPRVRLNAASTETAVRRLLQASGHDLDKLIAAAKSRSFKPVPLGLRTSLAITNTISKVQTANVVGLLTGSDPHLKHQVVVYSAHHDHLGIFKPDATGDRIYNGARDNASGCAQLLATARALTALPERPRRSVLMLFVAAEERGLLGSKYYARHPTVAPRHIAANINYDGGNIWGRTRDLALIGYGKSSLDGVAESVAALQGRKVVPDQLVDRGYYYRSDQFSFAKIGVPAIFVYASTDFVGRPAGWGKQQLEAWEKQDYHRPSDELNDAWNFDGMIEDAQFGFLAGWLVAQSDALPSWNPGDEFEAARKRALTEAER